MMVNVIFSDEMVRFRAARKQNTYYTTPLENEAAKQFPLFPSQKN